MSYSLEQLADDIRASLQSDANEPGKQAICRHVSKALVDPAFVDQYLKNRSPGQDPREVLYEDSDTGFCICGHVYAGAAIGEPHDHGPSWAIYGQATGETTMTDWEIVESGDDNRATLVSPISTYTLKPGDVRLYDIGAVHSPHRGKPVKLLRIEGENLDMVKRSNIKALG